MNPAPIDINKLRGILDKSRAVIKKIESDNPIVLSEVNNREYDGYNEPNEDVDDRPYEEKVMTSKLPDVIKKVMLSKPIPQVTGINNTFSAQQLYNEADEKEMPTTFQKKPTQKRTITENRAHRDSDLITISKSELSNLINEKLLEFFKKSYDKTLTEETIKRTIKTLLNEGRIVPKKKL